MARTVVRYVQDRCSIWTRIVAVLTLMELELPTAEEKQLPAVPTPAGENDILLVNAHRIVRDLDLKTSIAKV